jgi:hypothetical protein
MYLACTISLSDATQSVKIIFSDSSNTPVELCVLHDDIRRLASPFDLTPGISDPEKKIMTRAVVDCHYSEQIGNGLWLIRLYSTTGTHVEYEVPARAILTKLPDFESISTG